MISLKKKEEEGKEYIYQTENDEMHIDDDKQFLELMDWRFDLWIELIVDLIIWVHWSRRRVTTVGKWVEDSIEINTMININSSKKEDCIFD